MLLLCVKTKIKTKTLLAAQLAPAENKQCKVVGAGAEALLYFGPSPPTLPTINSYAYFSICQIMSPYTLFSPFQFYFIGFESQEAKIYINIFTFFLPFILFELIIPRRRKSMIVKVE